MASKSITTIEDWVALSGTRYSVLNSLGAAALVIGSIAWLGIEFFAVYATTRYLFEWPVWVAVLTGLLAIALLFVIHRTRGDQIPSRLIFEFGEDHTPSVRLYDPAFAGWVSAIEFIPYLGFLIPVGLGALCLGVSSLEMSARMARRADRFRDFPCDDISKVLSLLVRAGERLPLAELNRRIQTSNWLPILQHLYDLPGVVFLTGKVHAVTLSEGLRKELAELTPAPLGNKAVDASQSAATPADVDERNPSTSWIATPVDIEETAPAATGTTRWQDAPRMKLHDDSPSSEESA